LHASPDACLLVDETGDVVYANDRVSDMFGYEPAELVDEPIELLVPEGVRDTHIADRNAYIENPRTRPMGAGLDLVACRKDGSTFPVDISLSPIEKDGSRYVLAVVRDVTEQEALRTKYRMILKAVPDPVIVADATTGIIVEANEQVTALTGYDPEELVGRGQTRLHPTGDEQRYAELFERHVGAEKIIFNQFPDGSNVYVETKDGDRIPVEINAHTFELDAQQLIVGVFRDITVRKRREQTLGRLHEASRELMVATDTEEVATVASETATDVLDLRTNAVYLYDSGVDALVPVGWSSAAERTFGGVPPSIPAGEGLAWRAYSTESPDVHADVRESDHLLNEQTSLRSELYLPLGKHGVLIVGSTTVDDFDATDEALARVLAANVEVALDRVERERELRQQNERLEEFASIASHDLRNPLNVAEGRLELAQREVESTHLDAVGRALDRMEELIEDLLTLARQGKTVADTTVVDLSELVDGCWQTVETTTATLVNETNRVIHADESRLRQLLENLVRNAVEHGGEDVTVTIGDTDGGFHVSDDGPGIPASERDRVFEAGYSSATDGTGFGLSIVKQIALAHGWDVTVTDGADGGTRFEITGVELAE
jgi:PAS domain S-box-containing protein